MTIDLTKEEIDHIVGLVGWREPDQSNPAEMKIVDSIFVKMTGTTYNGGGL